MILKFSQQEINVGVSGVIIDHNKILIIKRNDIKSWALPGGRVEKNEALEDAVKREIFEETGLKVEPESITGIYIRSRWRKNILFVFRCRVISGNIKTSTESDRVEWCLISDASHFLNRNIQDRLSDATQNNGISLKIQNRASLKLIALWTKKSLMRFFNREKG